MHRDFRDLALGGCATEDRSMVSSARAGDEALTVMVGKSI